MFHGIGCLNCGDGAVDLFPVDDCSSAACSIMQFKCAILYPLSVVVAISCVEAGVSQVSVRKTRLRLRLVMRSQISVECLQRERMLRSRQFSCVSRLDDFGSVG